MSRATWKRSAKWWRWATTSWKATISEPEVTASVMSGPWFHTGDMAVWDEDGFIHIVDRKKEIIISGGENISSLEVEQAIFAHPDVFECAVVAAPHEKWGEVPVAIVVRKPGSELTGGCPDGISAGAAREIQAAAGDGV